MALAPSGWRKLAPLRRQAKLHRGFLFLPVLVADEAVARQAKAALALAWRTHAWAWQEVSVPWTAGNTGELSRLAWTAALDLALDRSQPGTAVVLDLSSSIWREVATDLAPWLNQRREPMRTRDLQLLLFWPADLKDALSSGAPDLWSVRAMNPLLTRDDLGYEALLDAGGPLEISGTFASEPRHATELDIRSPPHDPGAAPLWETFTNIQALLEQGRSSDALTLARQAQVRAAAEANAGGTEALRNLAMSHSSLGDALRDLGRIDDAHAAYDDALKLHRSLHKQLGDLPIVLMDLSRLLGARGDLMLEMERPEDAHQAFAEVLHMREALRTQYGDTVQSLRDLALAHHGVGRAQHALNRLDDARQAHAKGLTLLETARGMPGGETPLLLRDLAQAHARIGDVLQDLGRLGEAHAHFHQSVDLREELLRMDARPILLLEQAHSYSRLGGLYLRLRRHSDALRAYAECLNLLAIRQDRLGGPTPADNRLWGALAGLGSVLHEVGGLGKKR